MYELNETHDPARASWLESANEPGADFPIQNLPFGVFRRQGAKTAPHCGIAIGDRILDISAVAQLFREPARAAAIACEAATLNALMALGLEAASALRLEVSRLLSTERADIRASIEAHFIPMKEAELHLPVRIGDFTDFYASVFHATNAGKMFRPDHPLLPNYKYVPVAYHSRASSVRVSGTAFHRPRGQVKPADGPPVYQPCRNLDYELELGFYIGAPSELGMTVPIARAAEHVFGFCLLNDWSARDIQAWEYQPLGPFLAKNFMTTVSPWVVTAEALAPFRTAAFTRPAGDPAPLPHLSAASDIKSGGLDITQTRPITTLVERIARRRVRQAAGRRGGRLRSRGQVRCGHHRHGRRAGHRYRRRTRRSRGHGDGGHGHLGRRGCSHRRAVRAGRDPGNATDQGRQGDRAAERDTCHLPRR